MRFLVFIPTILVIYYVITKTIKQYKIEKAFKQSFINDLNNLSEELKKERKND